MHHFWTFSRNLLGQNSSLDIDTGDSLYRGKWGKGEIDHLMLPKVSVVQGKLVLRALKSAFIRFALWRNLFYRWPFGRHKLPSTATARATIYGLNEYEDEILANQIVNNLQR